MGLVDPDDQRREALGRGALLGDQRLRPLGRRLALLRRMGTLRALAAPSSATGGQVKRISWATSSTTRGILTRKGVGGQAGGPARESRRGD
ncbi:hypothetical protein [Sorangium sp. So ce1000]|uniref:hypothetical protein n=1 Tax=Sorangium sp. So ce1000 TaxID=3133325 RepID=UPI003F5FFF33